VDFRSRDSVEAGLLEYFDAIVMEEQKGADSGTKLLAAIGHFYPSLGVSGRGKQGCPPRVARALQGWCRLVPAGSIDALPEMAVEGVAVELCRKTKYDMALATVLDLDAYLRPGELLSLRKSNLIPPQEMLGRSGRYWSLLMHQVDQKLSKIGVYDDSILLDSEHRQWMSLDLKKLYDRTAPGGLLFTFTMSQWSNAFQAALKELGLPKTVLYSLRHAGPTADVLAGRRDLVTVKKRGRWISDSSLRRYEKAAKSLSIAQSYPLSLREHLRWCHRQIANVMRNHVVPRRFPG